ncbi:MAG TPA: indolepyruvate ferredoxin oxidoreductase subunit alpha [Saccharofermentans sp.]|jgi:indolepyruvate ferredoxin oxidoreductase alpha subunit|nr:indolepyruvate ferredoxin oxidoreductase subunit alpha [Saccharofermentans sp.]HPE27340.1 indolepyruvate ferredoxin oxidoreductase subunit alpha [Saccharofermentans sp.]HPQ32079.1 indolepyruvate ferredoxin oxidoreductase subunit alpha [Saccharofermentans sp.]HRV50679.1 indolepyruvate ferredoxin oxidoreductase subunit alpha [Saccharofermentans sp.]
MHTEFVMGNEAIALGAIAAGVNLVSGYPGTPSTEVLETIAKKRTADIYVEWSINEKAAMEVAAGASYAGARVMVTMKQVGLNVASDPLMCLEYVGIKGGMIILVADDPGPISSQTEQDTRNFAQFSKIPCFDPSSAKEAYDMVEDAFDYSERYKTPVILRSTTRVCHGYASIEIKDENEFTKHTVEGFIKDTGRWVIFPRLSYANHKKIVARNEELSEVFSGYKRNLLNGDKNISKKGIATGGISYTYVMESLASNEEYKNFSVFKVATPYPFPEKLAVGFLTGLDEVLCIEELDPVIEKELVYICGKYNLDVKIRGKLTHDIQVAGENSIDSVSQAIGSFASVNLSNTIEETKSQEVDPSILPVRPPVLCAGCPHRASFYAVKQAMKGQKTIFCGDIGCYTMGNAMPLDMCDTCLCMGAGLGIAQGVGHVEADTKCFAFVGDSTFFASAITGVINAVYNGADMTLVVLDNSTTAMTGHQPHPGTGRTAMGDVVEKISIENVLKGIGLQFVKTVDPLDYQLSVATVKEASELRGVKAIIFKSPCIVLNKPTNKLVIDSKICTGCKKCIRELGCPALIPDINGKVKIDPSLCTGCLLCSQICPFEAMLEGGLD